MKRGIKLSELDILELKSRKAITGALHGGRSWGG
jgi:hypothetical protein